MGVFRGHKIVQEAAPIEPVKRHSAEARFNAASAVHTSALEVIHEAASRLTEAHGRYNNLISELSEEIEHLTTLQSVAVDYACKAHDSAQSILDLTRGFRND